MDTRTATFHDFISPTEELIAEAQSGRMFILVDDEDRENEGDLVIPAQFATPDAINFMARHARGLICLALTRQRVEALGLPLMAQSNGTRHQTAFTVSIEAASGVTTGISAADRARTIAVAINPDLGREHIVTPGHVFPLVARDGGVLVLMQPFIPGFHRRHHLPYIEFYQKVLADTRDPREMETRFEEDFADRREYIEAYRHHHSYHGAHPFYVWYWCGLALERLERVIVVGAKSREVVERLGFEAAASMEEAWRTAGETLGEGYSITHLSIPPIFAVEME